MADMAPPEHPQRLRDPWLPAFVLAIATLCGSLIALAWVSFDAVSDGQDRVEDPPGLPPTATGAPGPDTTLPLSYDGVPPPANTGLALTLPSPGQAADITFRAEASPGAVAVGWYAPAASLDAGVDALTMDQLVAIVTGQSTNWSQVGGRPGPIRLLQLTGAPAPGDIIPGVAVAAPADPVAGAEALRAAMAPGSGAFAVIPIEALHPPMVALSIDGLDIVRSAGDPAAWPLAARLSVVGNTPRGRAALDEVRSAIHAPAPHVTRVVVTGDILQSRCSLAAIEASGDWAAAFRTPLGEYLVAADLTLGSQDGSIQDIAEPYGCVPMDAPNLTSPPEVIEGLKLAGFDALTVATNHIFDCADAGCGSEAMLRTIELLNAAGVRTVGGGEDLEAALKPAIFDVGGITVGVLGFDDIAAEYLAATATSPGTAPMDDSYEDEQAAPPEEPAFYKPAEMLALDRLEASVRQLASEVDVAVVLLQSGFEDTHVPSPRSLKAARAAADAGATLVVGNQAHWVQGVEVRGDTFIAYALGNLVFDQVRTEEHTHGYLLEATFHGATLVTTRMLPYRIEERYRPEFADEATRARILGDVIEASLGLPE